MKYTDINPGDVLRLKPEAMDRYGIGGHPEINVWKLQVRPGYKVPFVLCAGRVNRDGTAAAFMPSDFSGKVRS